MRNRDSWSRGSRRMSIAAEQPAGPFMHGDSERDRMSVVSTEHTFRVGVLARAQEPSFGP
jgi:hypothetical protein